jgi:hypothetical protein
MSRWGELIPHDEDAAEEGRCLCGCQDDDPGPVRPDEETTDEEDGPEGGHDFQWGDGRIQRCTRCTLPHSQWAGGPCPGPEHPLKPGEYV